MNLYLNLVMILSMTGCASEHYFVHKDGLIDVHLMRNEAQEVYFASSADDFRMHRPLQKEDGRWVVEDLTDKEFRYFYMVDGALYLPTCQYRENDDFGRQNCIHQP